jgi:putative Mg2+ transporter-C (MgtC) family protein
MALDPSPAVRLIAAAAAGGALGLPAELKGQPAGLRTHMLVAAGAALFCITANRVGTGGDELRALQGIASGIGFVGAATVLKERGRVLGVSTAAAIWVAAAVGCEAALGDVGFALGVAGVVAVLKVVLRTFEERFLDTAERRVERRGLPPE